MKPRTATKREESFVGFVLFRKGSGIRRIRQHGEERSWIYIDSTRRIAEQWARSGDEIVECEIVVRPRKAKARRKAGR